MKIGEKIKFGRTKMNLTQQELADKLHVTRQALSKWENNQNYPNLDVLLSISKILHTSLDDLLDEDDHGMVRQISNDVRKKRRYVKYFITIGILLLMFSLSSSIFIYGRINQVDRIDVLNPFLKTEYGYAVLPTKAQSGKMDALVVSDPFGHGSWLNFLTGLYDKKHHWALVKHKGSFVFNARPIAKNYVPINIRDVIGDRYSKYENYINSGPRSNTFFNNF
ncbi:helix-turn-helix transcriptional regulator [Apilactobacillus micheneri]|uniref:helix-turn-helix transcriptional regulator n=1 Tax=Apilactobacillus micheneri TaxID=1899430 RepID=UPI001127E39B|nr:helix-turn-helix transcriptional regulator [Apilactobacillus micheneri]TPR39022.1 XRE family transcriptional regulator [Apilactobacillus micheneri]